MTYLVDPLAQRETEDALAAGLAAVDVQGYVGKIAQLSPLRVTIPGNPNASAAAEGDTAGMVVGSPVLILMLGMGRRIVVTKV